MLHLRQSTASQSVIIGPFINSTDGNTAEAGLTISNTDIRLSANGGNMFAKTSGGGTHDEIGYYTITFDATDTATVGSLQLAVHEAGALPVYHEFEVLEENVYDSIYAASANLGTNVNAILADTGTDGVAISGSTLNAISDTVWDEAASGHVAAGSFGARLAVIRSATAQAGAGTTITLDASASAVDDFYNNTQISIVSGTGVGQMRFITDYVGSSKVATVATWITNPDATSVFVISGFGSLPGATAPTASENADAVWDEVMSGHLTSGTFGQAAGGEILRTGTAQAGAASTITLDASASATNELYRYSIIRIIGGTGAGQSRQISAYVGSSKVATVALTWATNPSSDSVFQIIALGVDAATVASIADGVWDEQRGDHVAAGSFGERTNANMTQVSGDTTAADNLEAMLDGTGGVSLTTGITGNVTGNLSGSVGSVTGNVAGNVVGSVGSVAGAVGSVTGAVGSVTGAVGSVTGNVGGTVNALATQAKLDVAAELVAIGLDHLVSTTVTGAEVADNSIVARLVSKAATADWDTFVHTTDSMEAIRDKETDIETDTQDLQARIPAALSNGSLLSDLRRINNVAITGDGSGTPFGV